MAQRSWIGTITASAYAQQRLYAFDTVTVGPVGPVGAEVPAVGERVALVGLGEAGHGEVLFGVGRVSAVTDEGIVVKYTGRFFDDPAPYAEAGVPGLVAIDGPAFDRLTTRARFDKARSEWFVMVALPIEADSAGEAVREFWTYVDKLGPQELPALVWPRGDELAMQAFVLGEEANQDPEED